MHVTFALGDNVERITIECDRDLVLQGEVRDNIRAEYPEGVDQPKLEPADAGVRLTITGDAN